MIDYLYLAQSEGERRRRIIEAAPKTCRLCGQPLRLERGPKWLPWLRCPRWPYRGAHWWSRKTNVEHDDRELTEYEYSVLRDEYLDALR